MFTGKITGFFPVYPLFFLKSELMEYMMIADRISGMGTTIFAVINSLAAEYNAVNLSQGAPDFDTEKWVLDIVKKSFDRGKNQYAPLPGVPELRSAISDLYESEYSLSYNPDTEISVTTGATEAIYSTVTGFINPGDEVIVFEPFYDSYISSVKMAGGIVRPVTLKFPDFSFESSDIEKNISHKTKMIIINNPHNPAGRVFRKEELKIIAGIAEKHDLIILSDEVYEFLVYGENRHIPFASLEGMKDRTVTVSSTGKTLSCTGWKIGYASAPEHLTRGIRGVRQWTSFSVNTPLQLAMAEILPNMKSHVDDFRDRMDRHRKHLTDEALKCGFRPAPAEGGYFFLAEFDRISDLPGFDFVKWLIMEKQVALIPVEGFYSSNRDEGRKLVRFNFAKSLPVIEQAIENLAGR